MILLGGISPVSICIYNACQSEIGFKPVLGGRRHVHKESVHLKSCACVKKEAKQWGMNDGTTFFFHLLSSDNVCCVCVRTHVCFYVHLCTRSYVKFPTSPPCLSVLRGFFYSFHLLPFHYSRKGFFMTHWCRITGLKSREAVLICHIHLLTSVLAVTYNSTGCDADVLRWCVTLLLTQIFLMSIRFNLYFSGLSFF